MQWLFQYMSCQISVPVVWSMSLAGFLLSKLQHISYIFEIQPGIHGVVRVRGNHYCSEEAATGSSRKSGIICTQNKRKQ